MRLCKIFPAILFGLILLPIQTLAQTSFYYTSSPTSWVGHGDTVLVTPDQGFTFNAVRNFDNGVSFAINDFAFNPDFQNTQWWYLDFAAPNNAALDVGLYLGATRFPFQTGNESGLSFSGNGRGNNTLTGQFSVLEAVYSSGGDVLSFAADFLQYDEGIQSWWNLGSIRYNSSVAISAVPEPSTWALLIIGLAFIIVTTTTARRRANWSKRRLKLEGKRCSIAL